MLTRLSCLTRRQFNLTSRFGKRVRRSPTQEAQESIAGRAIPGYSTGAKVTGVLSAGALGATVFYGLNLGKGDRAADRAGFWPQYVRDRISATYSYLLQSLFITGGSTYLALRSPAVMSLMSRGGLISIFATIACMIGLQMAVRSAPYQAGEFNGVKKAFWAAHAAFLGAFIAPLVAMYGDVVAQAALYTGGITAGISTLGWCAPSKEFMNLMGPASMAMGAVFIAALASPFFSPTSPAGGMIFSFVLWGGMIFSGAMIFMHTQQMIHQAESHPGKSWNGTGRDYDPINASLGLYIAMINMFQRMIFILGMNKRK